MKRIVCSVVLSAVMAGLIGVGSHAIAPAQDKTKTPPKEKAKEDAGSIEVWMAKDGWRWKVLSAEGKTIAMGTTGFAKKEDALNALETVKSTLNKGKVEVKEEKK